jgi:hypothetical protein
MQQQSPLPVDQNSTYRTLDLNRIKEANLCREHEHWLFGKALKKWSHVENPMSSTDRKNRTFSTSKAELFSCEKETYFWRREFSLLKRWTRKTMRCRKCCGSLAMHACTSNTSRTTWNFQTMGFLELSEVFSKTQKSASKFPHCQKKLLYNLTLARLPNNSQNVSHNGLTEELIWVSRESRATHLIRWVWQGLKKCWENVIQEWKHLQESTMHVISSLILVYRKVNQNRPA